MPPKKQPPQQDPEKDDDALVTSKQFQEMMHMMESLTASMNETFNKTTTSMNKMFHKSQASTETTHERVQRGIAAMVDRVQALETRLPIAATDLNVVTDPNAAVADTHVDGDPIAKDPRIDKMSTLSILILLHAHVDPSTDKVWEVIKITTTNTMFATMILLLKLNFLSLLLMARMMTVEQKFSSHLVPKQYRVR
jgi:hypothetical protein